MDGTMFLAGQQIVSGRVLIDLASTMLSADERILLKHPAVAGVVLFNRNFDSPQQVRSLCSELREIRPGLIIGVDHEGGRIQSKVGDFLTPIPSMQEMWSLTRTVSVEDLEIGYSLGLVIGAELRYLGFSLVFGPVLDIDHGVSPVIGCRSISSSSEVVRSVGGAILLGLAESGINACGKHFPGHGHAVGDPFEVTPVDERSAAAMSKDMLPFVSLSGHLPAVMTAHVRYVSRDSQIASCSEFWHRRLRNEINFRGAIVCDDISMPAARAVGDEAETAHIALRSGADLVLAFNQRNLKGALEILDRCETMAEQKDLEILARITKLGHHCDKTQIARERYVGALDIIRASEPWRTGELSQCMRRG